MIQVDVFWSFAMGAAFASLGTEGIKRSSHIFINKYFAYTVCYLSMLFAPSGIYLLWHFTGWETMFFLDRSLHGIWPCIFANTNVSLGVLGFIICYKLIKAGKHVLPHVLWTSAYTCMFAILTLGYDRFLYAGTLEEWRDGKKYEIQDFFHCDVFHTLLVMGAFILPPLYYAMVTWPSEYGLTRRDKGTLLRRILLSYIWAAGMVVVGYHVCYGLGHLPETWGYDRIVAFVTGEIVFGSMIFVPLMMIRTSCPKKNK